MPGMNWGREKRRMQMIQELREKRLASMDPSSVEYAEDPKDTRPVCAVCDLPVTPGGDEEHVLSSGTRVHKSCLEQSLPAYQVTVCVTEQRTYLVHAKDEEVAEQKAYEGNGALLDSVIGLRELVYLFEDDEDDAG